MPNSGMESGLFSLRRLLEPIDAAERKRYVDRRAVALEGQGNRIYRRKRSSSGSLIGSSIGLPSIFSMRSWALSFPSAGEPS